MEKPDIKLKYCDCRKSNITTCSALATHKVVMIKRGADIGHASKTEYRCDSCLLKGTVGWKVGKTVPFDQLENAMTVHRFLTSIVGKSLVSSTHSSRFLNAVFVKKNGGVMCQHPLTGKWKYVYFHQINKVLD